MDITGKQTIPDRWVELSPWRGIMLLLTSRKRYLKAAVDHCAAQSMQAPDLRQRFLRGEFVPNEDGQTALQERQRMDILIAHLWGSFLSVAVLTILVLSVSFAMGSISVDYTLSLQKLLAYVGAFLTGWAGLFEAKGVPMPSWKRRTLSELVHRKLFLAIFTIGVTFLLIAAIT